MKLTAKQRAALPDSDFGIPETRQFPIHDANHVRSACRYLKYAPKDKKAALIKRINKRAKELGMNLSVSNEGVYYDPMKGTSLEASNVGTLEPIVSPTETVIPGGGHLLDGEKDPSFGAKVMDMVFKKKIVREDTVLEEGAVISKICIPDPNDVPSFANIIREKIKSDKPHLPMRDVFSKFEEAVRWVIAAGNRRNAIRYELESSPSTNTGDADNMTNWSYLASTQWNEVTVNAKDLIADLVRDSKTGTPEEVAMRIYRIINTCPEEDLTYLMSVLYNTCEGGTERAELIFAHVCKLIADGKSVFKGYNASNGRVNTFYEGKAGSLGTPESFNFTSEEIDKISTAFGSIQFWNLDPMQGAFGIPGDPVIIYRANVGFWEFVVNELLRKHRIEGYYILKAKDMTQYICFVKIDGDINLLYSHTGSHTYTAYRLFDRNEDITKLVDICLRIVGKYGKDCIFEDNDPRLDTMRRLFKEIGYFTYDLLGEGSSPVNESVASIFKDVKSSVVKALRRIHIEKDGDVSINLKDELTLANYSETHRLLMADLASDDLTGLKMNTAYVFSLITIIETKYLFGKKVDKYSQDYKDAIKLRGMLINDFNVGLNAIRAKEPGFSFIKFYKDSGYENAVYKFNTKAITNLGTAKLVETVFQNAMKLKGIR